MAGSRRLPDASTSKTSSRRTSEGSAALHHRRQRGRRQVHADRPAALRLARASTKTSSPPCARRRQPLGRRPSISRCSPTACAPSASRASPSTSPIATSPRRGASSSSPTRRATSSTRATWPPAPRPPTSPSSWSTRATACCRSRAATPTSPSLLGIPHIVVAVNKMDLVDFRQDVFDAIRDGILAPSPRSWRCRATCTSSRSARCDGDNVVEPQPAHALVRRAEPAGASGDRAHRARPQPDRLPLPGAVRDPAQSGFPRLRRARSPPASIRRGDAVMALPSRPHQPREIHRHLRRRAATRRSPPHVGHGLRWKTRSISAAATCWRLPATCRTSARHFDATVVWMNEKPLEPNRSYLLKHTTAGDAARVRASATASTSTRWSTSRRAVWS